MERVIKHDRTIREVAEGNFRAQEYLDRANDRKWTRRVEVTIWWVIAGLVAFVAVAGYLTRF